MIMRMLLWLLALGSLGFISPRLIESQRLLYKKCSPVKYRAGSSYQRNLNSLLGAFLSQAYADQDYSNVREGSGSDAVDGFYSCKGHLGREDCANCLKNAMSLISHVCLQSCGVLIELDGCLLQYERINSFCETDNSFIYKTCSGTLSSDDNFDNNLNTVLSDLMTTSSFKSNSFGSGVEFSMGSVFGFAKCKADISDSDCNDCINAATQRLNNDCGASVSGHVYLSKCHVGYDYEQDVLNRNSSGNGNDSTDNGDNGGKTVAIIIGLLLMLR